MSHTALTSMDKLTNAGSLLTKKNNLEYIALIIVEQAIDSTKSDIACLYINTPAEKKNSHLKLIFKRGNYPSPKELDSKNELIDFITDCSASLVMLERKKSPFFDIFLNEKMQSGIIIPIITKTNLLGILILNSLKENFYDREKIFFLESLAKIAGGILNNQIIKKQQ